MNRGAVLWAGVVLGVVLVGSGLPGWHGAPPGVDALARPPAGLPVSTAAPAPPATASVPLGPPVTVRLPTLGTEAAIVPVDVGPDRALDVPDDPRLVGWWQAGAQPGSAAGAVVLDGHVDTHRDGPGALFRLAELQPGDPVVVGTAAGELTYVVVEVRSHPKGQLPAETFHPGGAPRLVLVTCGGPFDRQLRRYTENVVALAVPAR